MTDAQRQLEAGGSVDQRAIAAVDAAIEGRRSVRGFLDRPVPRDVVESILRVSSRAPSGVNMQPWHVDVLTGDSKRRFSDAILALASQGIEPEPQFAIYPPAWRSPFLERRRKVGLDMYGRLGIARGDAAGARAQMLRNFDFFGAPVGMIVSMEAELGHSSWLDVGMFLQSIMMAAEVRGLATCPQAAFAPYHAVIREHLGLPASRAVLCGMALGYEDRSHPLSPMRTDREPVASFARFHS